MISIPEKQDERGTYRSNKTPQISSEKIEDQRRAVTNLKSTSFLMVEP